MPLSRFHPVIERWFANRFAEPTEPQCRAWPVIQQGGDILIAAPTGSGKTFAAFLSAIDGLVRQGLNGELKDEMQVVYVSPLKALSNDVQKNLSEPLAEIRATLAEQGLPDVVVRTLVRTGDTPQSERQAMLKQPPHILLITQHRTTLVFVNTRRLAERLTMHLSERIGADHVTSHHGSLSREKRLEAEERLKRGELKALVATASLELGIDIGSVDLVIQVGSTRSIATLLQRVGRAGHRLGAIPKGRLFPLARDELIECAAMLRATREGRLDRLIIPNKPLDILAQQIVAATAGEEWDENELYERVRSAYPYRELSRAEFDAVVQMLAEGFTTRRGRRSAHIHYDGINRKLKGRRGARIAAITAGGAIPDLGDYRVILEPTETFVGTLNEDFAIESTPGDIFQLGNTSYQIVRVESGQVRVADAKRQPPTLPFWLGE